MRTSFPTTDRRSLGIVGAVATAAVPLAAWAVAAAVAAGETWEVARWETAYLGLVTASVMAAAAFLAPPPATEVWLGGPLAALALVALPAGPARGAVAGAVAVALLAVAGVRRMRHLADELGEASPAPLAAFAAAAPLCFGVQVLLRADRLLDPRWSAEVWIGVVVLPLAAASALAVLAAARGGGRAWVAGAAVVALTPGFNVAATLSLAALAAGVLLREAGSGTARLVRFDLAPAAVRGLALAVLAAPFAWEPRAAAVGCLAAAALAGGARTAALAGLAAMAWGLAGPEPALAVPAALAATAWILVLLPALPWALVRRAEGWSPAVVRGAAAVAVAWAAARTVPGEAALAAPLAAIALLTPQSPGAAGVQRSWSGGLVAASCALAAYPWLRPAPACDALALLGLSPGWGGAAALVAAAGLAIGAASLGRALAAGRGGSMASPAAWAAALVLAAAAGAVPRDRPVLLSRPEVLDVRRPRMVMDLRAAPDADPSPAPGLPAAPRPAGGRPAVASPAPPPGPRPVDRVVLESNLAHAAALAAGTRVAAVRLRSADGRLLAEWPLASGTETGEWAARRRDVVAAYAPAAPVAFRARIDVDGAGRPFFAQDYRVLLALPFPVAAARLEIERAPGLPPEVVVKLLRAEAGR